MRIGFIGLGIMGSRMAANLIKAGYDLVIYNRTAAKAKPLLDAGAEWSDTPAELATQVDLVFTVLAHPDAVAEMALGEDGFLEHLPAGAMWIDCSTVAPSFSRRMAAAAAARGLRFMDAPVAGSKGAAADGQLTFIAGGSEEDLEEYRPELESMGVRIVHAGETGMGSSLKVVLNHQLAIAMAAFSEGLVLGQELGLDREFLLDFILNGAVAAPFLKNKRSKIEEGDFEVEFPLQWMQKDLHMASVAGYECGAALPLGSTTKELYKLAMRAGYGEQDFSAIYQFLYEEWDVE